jgi:hypothetical protein
MNYVVLSLFFLSTCAFAGNSPTHDRDGRRRFNLQELSEIVPALIADGIRDRDHNNDDDDEDGDEIEDGDSDGVDLNQTIELRADQFVITPPSEMEGAVAPYSPSAPADYHYVADQDDVEPLTPNSATEREISANRDLLERVRIFVEAPTPPDEEFNEEKVTLVELLDDAASLGSPEQIETEDEQSFMTPPPRVLPVTRTPPPLPPRRLRRVTFYDEVNGNATRVYIPPHRRPNPLRIVSEEYRDHPQLAPVSPQPVERLYNDSDQGGVEFGRGRSVEPNTNIWYYRPVRRALLPELNAAASEFVPKHSQ